MRISRLAKPIALVLAVTLTFMNFPTSLLAQVSAADVINETQKTLGKASPVNLLLGGLVDRAVESGNSALQQRLDQLNGILQSAIFSLNQVLKENIQNLDSAARKQRVEAVRALGGLIDQVNALLQADFNQLDTILQQNIANLQNSLGNTVASLPIPTEPLVNVGGSGISIIRQEGNVTKLSLTGSGLFKSNTKPEATLIDNNKEIPLVVEAASMGLILLSIPNNALPTGLASRRYVLRLKLYKGYFFHSYPSFPLQVCGGVPRYSFDAVLTASNGTGWERRTTAPEKIYLECTGDGQTTQINASAPDPWIVDKDIGTSGLIIGQTGGDNYHSEKWLPGTATFQLYCAKNGGRGSNSWAYVQYAQKRKIDIAQCGKSEVLNVPLPYDKLKQAQLNPAQALGSCDLSLTTPVSVVAFTVKDSAGQSLETVNVPVPFNNKVAMGGSLNLSIDGQGLLNASFSPACKLKYSYAHE